MGVICDKFLAFGIPVFPELSNEEAGEFKFGDLTWEQQDLINKILFGFPITFDIDSVILISDGVDVINMTVTGEPNTIVQVDYTFVGSGITESLDFTLDETGKWIQPFACDTGPGKIVFTCSGIERTVRIV
jgi:hypothetical protein